MCNIFRKIYNFFVNLDEEYYPDSIENIRKYNQQYKENIFKFYESKLEKKNN